jgi:hypothetical protein
MGQKKMQALVEKSRSSLGGLSGLKAVQKVAINSVFQKARSVIQDTYISLTFDGSKVNYSIEAVIARFLDSGDRIRHLCVGVSSVPKSINADSMLVLLQKHLAFNGIKKMHLVAAISDSGPPNPSAMAKWNETSQNVFFGEELDSELLLWMPCLMHSFSNSGQVLKKKSTFVKPFMSAFKRNGEQVSCCSCFVV